MVTTPNGPPVLARVVFEIVGNPKEHVVESMQRFIYSVKKEEGVSFVKEYVAEPEERDGLWSTFAEIEMRLPDIDKLSWLCVNFTPASIEVIEPREFKFTDKDMTNWQNDLLAVLHEVGMHAKNLTSENDLLKVNINHLIRNSILLILKHAKAGLSAKEIGSEIGVEDDAALLPFLEAMEKENRIRKAGSTYHLA